jgi:hypothetical protein
LFHSVHGAEGGQARDRDTNLARRDDVRPFVTAQACGEVRERFRALDERRAVPSQT